MKRFLIAVLMLSFWSFVGAVDDDDLTDLSLSELLNVEISVGSTSEKKTTTLRDTPGIISVIRGEDIQRMGARDLIDVLRLVPGFFFGVDVQGVVGTGIRGNWGHEGKILMLIDGREMNELLFTTLQFGNHYPIDHIAKIEIIRGPGSAIYGGFAELAVINIITKTGKDLNGLDLDLVYGRMSHETGRADLSLSYGREIGELTYSLAGLFGTGNRSESDYVDIYGDSFNMTDQAELNPSWLNFGAHYRGWDLRVIFDYFETTTRDMFDIAAPVDLDADFHGQFYALKYNFDLSDSLSATWTVDFKSQRSWEQSDENALSVEVAEHLELDNGAGYKSDAERLGSKLTFLYAPESRWDLQAGIAYYRDKGTLRPTIQVDDERFDFGPGRGVSYDDYAAFAQAGINLNPVQLTIGGRWEDHSQAGSRFVPRVGLTGVFQKFHFKALYAQAFRTPAIENIEANAAIEAEETNVLELEAGYQIGNDQLLTANVFDIEINDPIVYFFDGDDNYGNFDKVGTRGLELEYRKTAPWGDVALNYSYYQAEDNRVEAYAVPQDQDLLLGAPQQKAVIAVNWKAAAQLRLHGSVIYSDERYGAERVDEEEEALIEALSEEWLANLYLSYSKAFGVEGLNVGIGVYNLFDEDQKFVQPYNNYHTPLPGPSREFVFKISYKK